MLRDIVKNAVKKVAKKVMRKLKSKATRPLSHAQLVAKFMSVKQSVPDGCTQDVFTTGRFLCMLVGPRPWTIEAWAREVAELAGAKVDWSFMGGRAVVKYLGDDQKVFAAAKATKDAFEEAAQILVKLHEQDKKNTEWCHPVQWLSRDFGQVPS